MFFFKVLPLLKLATGFLSKNQEEGTENGPKFKASAILKRRLLRSIRTRFHNMEEEDPDRRAPKFFSVATFLDPRYMINNIEQKHKFTDIFLFVFLDL
jgi:hypothetical protein